MMFERLIVWGVVIVGATITLLFIYGLIVAFLIQNIPNPF